MSEVCSQTWGGHGGRGDGAREEERREEDNARGTDRRMVQKMEGSRKGKRMRKKGVGEECLPLPHSGHKCKSLSRVTGLSSHDSKYSSLGGAPGLWVTVLRRAGVQGCGCEDTSE